MLSRTMRWLTSSARGRHTLAAQASSVGRSSPSKRTAHASARSALAREPPTLGATAAAPASPWAPRPSALSSTTRAVDLLPLRRRHRRPCRTSATTSPHMSTAGKKLDTGGTAVWNGLITRTYVRGLSSVSHHQSLAGTRQPKHILTCTHTCVDHTARTTPMDPPTLEATSCAIHTHSISVGVVADHRYGIYARWSEGTRRERSWGVVEARWDHGGLYGGRKRIQAEEDDGGGERGALKARISGVGFRCAPLWWWCLFLSFTVCECDGETQSQTQTNALFCAWKHFFSFLFWQILMFRI